MANQQDAVYLTFGGSSRLPRPGPHRMVRHSYGDKDNIHYFQLDARLPNVVFKSERIHNFKRILLRDR
ncbi:unnamed protein product [Pleuronectes platessa]|uniref:Uncharacterized protein n=1 Tax=Pleuronectes platessa TaxID=8262 RepID=A0A9N7TX09_PLEPL|nr:unnamed protein product [Pleuronectes platessa]